MSPQIVHLPDGQKFTVTPVFAGLFFKSNELNTHPNAFPIGWSVVLHTEEGLFEGEGSVIAGHKDLRDNDAREKPAARTFTQPTLHDDHLFISSISNPSPTDFKPPVSPSRQIAMMLFVTLYWYFHQPAPDRKLRTDATNLTPGAGKPRGDWRINIKRDGLFRSRNLIPKLERMGLIASLESAVGTAVENSAEGWSRMFVSQRAFWQTPARLFLFTLEPATARPSSSYQSSPTSSRPGSPAHQSCPALDASGMPTTLPLTGSSSLPITHFFSHSHLPTYYPPPPVQYTMTDNVRHPLRPKPPRMGEVFYTRFIPSVGQYLSFRVASLSNKAVPYPGPVGTNPPQQSHLNLMDDTSLLQTWLSKPRVSAFWGTYVPHFLTAAFSLPHSFPAIGMWDGVPFGYFEIYWVKEDVLGRYAGGADDWDRGFHVLVGEEWARGRVPAWLSSMVHWALNADIRTMSVCIEPRVDNERFIQHLQHGGFSKEKEISFPHKQAWFGRLRRECFSSPAF